MKDLRRSWHCRRLFFRYLRQKDKEKQEMNNLQTSNTLNDTDSEHKGLTKPTIILLLIGLAFLILFIVFISIGQAELDKHNVDWDKVDVYYTLMEIFGALLIAWIVLFPIIQITRTIYQGQRQLQQQQIQKRKWDAYLNEHKDLLNDIINQYYEPTKNFIESCSKYRFSLSMFSIKKAGYELFNKNSLCASYLEKDGFPTDITLRLIIDEDMKDHNNLSLFIQSLRKRVSTQWTDLNTLDTVVYLVFRNNLIKYFYNLYTQEFNCETVYELCSTFEKGIVDSSMFTYYYLFKNDINAPIVPTFNQICAKITSTFEQIEKTELEQTFFDTINQEEPTKSLNISQSLSLIEKVDSMTGEEFERFMEKYFIKKGYKVTRTPLSGDYGIDLIIEHEFGKIGVQLKCYFDKVPLKAVQEVVAGLNHYELSSGMVITNSYFQPSAIRLAKDNKITLWDRDTLIEKLEA